MKSILPFVTLSLLLTFCGSPQFSELETNDDKVKLPFTGATLSIKEINSFARLNVLEIIQKLRVEYGVKVLILAYTTGYPDISVQGLENLNLKEDVEAVRFYTKIQQKVRPPGTIASFLEAGLVVPEIPLAAKNRVYLNHDIMILHLNAEKNSILHEVIHLLIKRSPEISKQKMSNGSNRKAKIDRLKKLEKLYQDRQKQFNIKKDQYSKGKIESTEFKEMVNKLITTTTDYAVATANYNDNAFGEEMDITRFMYEKKDLLHSQNSMSRAFYINALCIGYYKESFMGWIKHQKNEIELMTNITPLVQLATQQNLATKETLDKFHSHIDKIKTVRRKLASSAKTWLEETSAAK